MSNAYLEQYKQQNLRACQLKLLDILGEIDRICRKHSIDYWLDGGSILGAVRHQGFIPWDDDIDIAMTLDGLKRFVAVAPAELGDRYELQTLDDKQNKEPITKVRDKNSFFVEGADNFDVPYPKGLYVDIFPFIDYPTVSRKFIKTFSRQVSRSYSILHKQHYYSLRAAAELIWFGVKYGFCRAVLAAVFAVKPKGVYMSNILINNGYGIMHRRDSIFPLSAIGFEGRTFPAPHNPDAYLKDLYNNYMEIPPEDKRKVHSVFFMPELIKP